MATIECRDDYKKYRINDKINVVLEDLNDINGVSTTEMSYPGIQPFPTYCGGHLLFGIRKSAHKHNSGTNERIVWFKKLLEYLKSNRTQVVVIAPVSKTTYLNAKLVLEAHGFKTFYETLNFSGAVKVEYLVFDKSRKDCVDQLMKILKDYPYKYVNSETQDFTVGKKKYFSVV